MLLAAVVGLAAEPPLSLDDVAALRAERPAAAVVRELRARGRAFDLDEAARERLEGLGFTTRQLGTIEKARRGVAAAELERSPEDDARLERLERTVKRAVELARGVTVVDTAHARLLLGSGVPPQVVDDVRSLEQGIARRFPGPLADGVDRRGCNVAVFATESEHAAWIAALEKSLAENGFEFAAGATLADWARRASSVSIEGITTVRASAVAEETRRTVVHACGYHAIAQLTRGGCGDALQSGFANVAETMIFGSPAVTVRGGYAEREIGAAATGWPQTVRQRFTTGAAGTAGQVLGYTFDVMEFPHYAECWSFTTVLCAKPDRFSKLVVDLREGGRPLAAVAEVYAADEAALTAGWKAMVVAGR